MDHPPRRPWFWETVAGRGAPWAAVASSRPPARVSPSCASAVCLHWAGTAQLFYQRGRSPLVDGSQGPAQGCLSCLSPSQAGALPLHPRPPSAGLASVGIPGTEGPWPPCVLTPATGADPEGAPGACRELVGDRTPCAVNQLHETN